MRMFTTDPRCTVVFNCRFKNSDQMNNEFDHHGMDATSRNYLKMHSFLPILVRADASKKYARLPSVYYSYVCIQFKNFYGKEFKRPSKDAQLSLSDHSFTICIQNQRLWNSLKPFSEIWSIVLSYCSQLKSAEQPAFNVHILFTGFKTQQNY